MLQHVWATTEALPTDRALERFDATVGDDVGLQLVWPVELLWTTCTSATQQVKGLESYILGKHSNQSKDLSHMLGNLCLAPATQDTNPPTVLTAAGLAKKPYFSELHSNCNNTDSTSVGDTFNLLTDTQ